MKVSITLLACDFCGKNQNDVEKLLAGPEPKMPCICNECVAVCIDTIGKDPEAVEPATTSGEVSNG